MTPVPTLSIRNASKTFAGRRVLDGIDLDLWAGEVHGLVGQNGSGKSTLIKILAGYHAPDSGCTLQIRGEDIDLPLSPTAPPQLGIAFVHQDLALVRTASVLENLFITRFRTRFPRRIDWRGERVRARNALDRLGLAISPGSPVSALAPTQQALVAIARAVDQLDSFDEGILVLDEPSAYLPRDGIDRLFELIKQAASQGIAVLFVGHDLDEIFEITNRVTVLRDGSRMACSPTAEVTHDRLVELILGFKLEDFYPRHHGAGADVALHVTDLESAGLSPVSFDARKGEILGLTGLLGSGYEAIPYAIFGGQPATGSIEVSGERLDAASMSPGVAMDSGIGLVPSNRALFGGALDATAIENVTLATVDRFAGPTRWLRHGNERRRVEAVMDDFDVRPRNPDQRFGFFSGGNQQKLVLAKWLELALSVLLLHEPTQGVDIGARGQILNRLRQIADQGAAVIVAGAEYQELAELCDRVLVFRRGALIAELAGDAVTHERILERCFAPEAPVVQAQTALIA